MKTQIIAVAIALLPVSSVAQDDLMRARDLGIPFEGTPGPNNAITDVAGVTVGHETIMKDLEGEGAVRTGVTAILPRGTESNVKPSFGAYFSTLSATLPVLYIGSPTIAEPIDFKATLI